MLNGIMNIAKTFLGGMSDGQQQPTQEGNDLSKTPLLQFAQNAIPGGELMKSFLA